MYLTDNQWFAVMIIGVILLEPLKDALAKRLAARWVASRPHRPR